MNPRTRYFLNEGFFAVIPWIFIALDFYDPAIGLNKTAQVITALSLILLSVACGIGLWRGVKNWDNPEFFVKNRHYGEGEP
jgi:hypothetical protein